jgi:hypothetical protein
LDDIFISQGVCGAGSVWAFFGAKHDLGASFAVSEIDEDDASVVARRIDPAGQGDFLTDVGKPKFVAVVRSVHGSRC